MSDLKTTVPQPGTIADDIDATAEENTNPERGKRSLGRKEAAKVALSDAITEVLGQKSPGVFDAGAAAFAVIQLLSSKDERQWAGIREQLVHETISGLLIRKLQWDIKAESRADARQGLLALPGFDLVSPWVRIEGGIAPLNKVTLEQHRKFVKDRAARIKQNEYPRWSPERMKREKAALSQERKLDRKVAPLSDGDEQMEMGTAMELYESTVREVAEKHTNRKKRPTAPNR